MKGCVCARHCDRSGNGIHTWLLRSMMASALEKRLGVDRMWPLYLTAGQKKNIRVYPCSYPQLSALKK